MKYPTLRVMSSIRLLTKLLHTAFHFAQQETGAQHCNGDAPGVHGGVWTLDKLDNLFRASAVHQRVFQFRFGLFAEETNKLHENEMQTRSVYS